MSIHQIAIGAEMGSSDRKDWQIYKQQMSIISEWIEKGLLKPIIKNIGSLSVETVQKAHDLLETGRVKGKLVMSVV